MAQGRRLNDIKQIQPFLPLSQTETEVYYGVCVCVQHSQLFQMDGLQIMSSHRKRFTVFYIKDEDHYHYIKRHVIYIATENLNHSV